MEINPLTIVSIVGVASLLIERVYYYKSRYKKNTKIVKPENPSHGERLVALETDMENIKEDIKEIKGKLNRK